MKPKVLFIRSGNKGQHPITQNQGNSLCDVGCDVHYYNVIGKGIVGYLKNVSKLRSYISAVRPDVLHAHYSLCGFLAVLTVYRGPIVVSLMGSDVMTSSWWYRVLIRFFARFFWSSVIVKSHEMYDVLNWRHAEIIPNGVNPRDFYVVEKRIAREQLGWPLEAKIVLFGSDPARKEKNYPLFQRAFNQMKSQGVNIQERHLVQLSKEEVNLYYNASDVLVLTSYHEGSPNVIKEAMFCHCPFVSVNVGDVASWVNMTKGNFLIDYDESEIIRGIKKIFLENHAVENGNAILFLDAQNIALRLKKLYIGLLSS